MADTSRQILRYGFVFLFLWFGYQQLARPELWLGFLPEWTGYLPIPGEMLVRLNGWLEIAGALFLAVGAYTRLVSLLLALHLLLIAAETGGAVGTRDIVLSLAGLALAASAPDNWTLDRRAASSRDASGLV